jgi:hypothetical protein
MSVPEAGGGRRLHACFGSRGGEKKKNLQQGGLGPGRTGRLCLGVRGRPRVRRLPCGGSGPCGTAAARMRTRAGRAREWSPRLDSRARAGAGAGGPNHFAIDYLSPSAALPVPVGGEPGTVLTPLSCSRSRSLNGRTPWGVRRGRRRRRRRSRIPWSSFSFFVFLLSLPGLVSFQLSFLFPPYQIISNSNNLRKLKYFKFNRNYKNNYKDL